MRERDKKLPIVLSVPVNLRNYFKSDTARNFFGVINVAFYPEQYDGTLESILKVVQASFKRQLTQDQVSLSMHDYARLEHNIAIRPVPLFIKNLVIAAVNKHPSEAHTLTLQTEGRLPRSRFRLLSVTGESTESYNDIGMEQVQLKCTPWQTVTESLCPTLAPHSVSLIEILPDTAHSIS